MAHIYVARGHSGLFKVGRTNDLKRRIASLKREFQRFGNEIAEVHSFDVLNEENADSAERRLLWKINGLFEQYSGREWFIGEIENVLVAAGIAAQEADFRKPFMSKFSADELAAMRAAHDAKREAYRLERIERTARAAAEVAARKELRLLRKREIAARILGLDCEAA